MLFVTSRDFVRVSARDRALPNQVPGRRARALSRNIGPSEPGASGLKPPIEHGDERNSNLLTAERRSVDRPVRTWAAWARERS